MAGDGATDAAVIEREDREAALRQIGGEGRVVLLPDAGGGMNLQRRSICRGGAEKRGAEPEAVRRAELDYFQACQSMNAPPTTISASMKSICRCACRRRTSH